MAWSDDELADRWSSTPWRAEEAFDAFLERTRRSSTAGSSAFPVTLDSRCYVKFEPELTGDAANPRPPGFGGPHARENGRVMTLEELAQEKYVSLTTFKRDGTPVSTPVWVAGDEGHLLVWSAADAWKVKRIRRDPHVRLAASSGTGKVHGEAVDAVATIVDDTTRVQELLVRKYGLFYRLLRLLTATMRLVRRRPAGTSVTLEIG